MVSVDATFIMAIYSRASGFEVSAMARVKPSCRVVKGTLACGKRIEDMVRVLFGERTEPCMLAYSFMIRNMEKVNSSFLMALSMWKIG